MSKEEEILDYFNERIFEPAIRYGKENHKTNIVRGVNYTRMRMSQLPARKMIQYFWSAIVGTEQSIVFSDIMARNGLTRFEDVLEEVRVRFNNDYFRD